MQKTYALFDFDGTLIDGDSIVRLIAYAKKHRLCRLRDVLAGGVASVGYALRLVTAERAKEIALRFLAGRPQADIERIAADFCQTELLPRLRPAGRAAVRAHVERGDSVLLVSASPSFYLEPLKQELGLTDILATRFAMDENGCFLDRIAGENCRGVQKPLRLAEYLAANGDRLDYDTSAAYGDSGGDAPMLNLCAQKVCVNAKRKLKARMHGASGVVYVDWKKAKS